MTSTREADLEQRLERVERAIESIQSTLDLLSQRRSHQASPGRPGPDSASASAGVADAAQGAVAPDAARRSPPPRVDFVPPRWIAARSAEWWLGALGVLFLVIALLLLYRYAVDHNWITPLVRVFTGAAVGAGLIAAGMRLTTPKTDAPDDTIGLREILLGGGVAALYITSYAAGVLYQLVSIPIARLSFLVLSVAAAWLALKERRLVFALIAVGVGFAAPFLLASRAQSLVGFSLYLGALGALGLVLYLMRGWQSVLWITFVAFWLDAAVTVAGPMRPMPFPASVALTLLLVAAGAAFTRVSLLRRRLVALGSDRYTPSATSDTPAFWIMTIASPMLMLQLLSAVLPGVVSELWGIAAIAFSVVAYSLSDARKESDRQVSHVGLTAAALWSLAGLLWILSSLAPRLGLASDPILVAAAALHAFSMMSLSTMQQFIIPRRIAKLTAAATLLTVVIQELSSGSPQRHWDWTGAEAVVLLVAAWFWRTLSRQSAEETQGTVFGTASYGVLLLVLSRVLGSVWPPLVTVSYALAGAALLLASRRGEDRGLLLKLGGLTMVIVVARLLVVDMSSVETIWRVLLFLVCGILFVYTSYRLQPVRARAKS